MLVAVWVAIVAVFVGSLLLAVAFQELSEDELFTVIGLGVIPALAVGVIVGVKYAKLAGWRDWLLVGLGSIAGFVAMNIVVETLGDGALYGFMGAGVAVLFFNRNRRK